MTRQFLLTTLAGLHLYFSGSLNVDYCTDYQQMPFRWRLVLGHLPGPWLALVNLYLPLLFFVWRPNPIARYWLLVRPCTVSMSNLDSRTRASQMDCLSQNLASRSPTFFFRLALWLLYPNTETPDWPDTVVLVNLISLLVTNTRWPIFIPMPVILLLFILHIAQCIRGWILQRPSSTMHTTHRPRRGFSVVRDRVLPQCISRFQALKTQCCSVFLEALKLGRGDPCSPSKLPPTPTLARLSSGPSALPAAIKRWSSRPLPVTHPLWH